MGFMKQIYFTKLVKYFLVLTVVLLLPSCNMTNDETPPEEVSNLLATEKGEAVEFQWTNPSDSDFSYVEIRTSAKEDNYYHTTIVPGKATSYVVEELTNNVEYEFTIITYDSSKNHSTGIKINSIPSGLGNVRNVIPTAGEDDISLSWTNPKDKKFAGIEITLVNENVPEEFDEETENTSNDSEDMAQQVDEVTSGQTEALTEVTDDASVQSEEITEQSDVFAEPIQDVQDMQEEEPVYAETEAVPAAEETDTASETDELLFPEEASADESQEEENPEEEAAGLSDEEIAELLMQNQKTVTEKKKFHKLTVRTDDTVISSYKFTGLESGTTYIVTLAAYDIEGRYSEATSFSIDTPAITDGLEYKLSADGTSYVVTSFVGDNSSEHVITPEEENGHIENPITVTVPKMHNGKPVSAIGTAAFKNCRNITEINLPASITSIGKNAFENCIGLEGVILPENTSDFEEGAFWNCRNLKWLVIPKSVKKIGLGAILNDTKLSTVFYTGTEEEWNLLEKNIDSGNSALKNFSKRILSKAAEIRFDYDGTIPIELMSPGKVENVVAEGGNRYALLSWKNPSDIDFAGVKIDVLDSAEKIIETHFISSLQNSFFVTGLENEETYSFNIYSFDKLKNMSEPVKSQKIKTELITQIDEDGFYYFINEDGISCSVCGCEESKRTVTVPENIGNYPVTAISEKAFALDNELEILVLPDTITLIADNAFEDCSALSNIYYCGPYSQWESIEGIEELDAVLRADFEFKEDDTEAPAEVTLDFIRRGDKKIGFDLTLPADSDFYGILLELDGESVQAVKVDEYSYAICNLENDVKYSICIKTQDIYGNVSEGINFAAEAGEILTEGVTDDGFHFVLCENESELSGTSYKIISYENKETSSFDSEKGINVVFPATIDDVVVTEIDAEVFAECTNIESVEIPATVVAIGNGAFCLKSLKNIYVNPANKVYSLNADGTILYSKKGNQKKLERVLPVVSGTVDFTGIQFTEITSKAFAECRSVTKIVLPARLKKIGDYAFSNCSTLSSVYIPSTVVYVGKNVFNGCDKLAACYYLGTEKQFNKIEFTSGDKKILSVIKYFGSVK